MRTHVEPAVPVQARPAPGQLLRCGGVQCPPGTCDHDGEEVRRWAAGPAPSAVPASVQQVLGSSGSPLGDSVRAPMEARFGHSFADVRVHTDEAAAHSAEAIQAYAYTFGRHVVMGAGRWQPHTPSGRMLLAHELTHVVQQSGSNSSPSQATSISKPDDPAEHEAEHLADPPYTLLGGESPPVIDGQAWSGTHRGHGAAHWTVRHDTTPGWRLGLSGHDLAAATTSVFSPLGTVANTVVQRDIGDTGESVASEIGNDAETPASGPAATSSVGTTTGPAAGPPLPARLRFWFKAFIPDSLPGAHIQPSGPYAGRQVFAGPRLPFHWNSCFETDERGFDPAFSSSSRMRFMIEFDTATGTATITSGGDLTFEVDCTSGAVKCAVTPTPRTSLTVIRPMLPGSRRYDVLFSGFANDPCVFGSPDIAIRGDLIIDLNSRTVDYRPLITLFPAIEMYADVGSGTVTCVTHPLSGGVGSLFIPGVVPVAGSLAF